MNNQTSITNPTDISAAIDALVWTARKELVALSAESKHERNRLMVFAKSEMDRAKHFIKAIKPAVVRAVASPSIAPSPVVEHAIALTTITSTPPAKMELETYHVNAGGGYVYRITYHSPRIWSVEKWVRGEWRHIVNCSTPEQIELTFFAPFKPAQPTITPFPVMAPVDTPIPAPVETVYRCHTLYAEAYRNGGGFLWRLKIRGPMQGGLVVSGHVSGEAAIKAGEVYVNDKYRLQARRGMAGL